MGGDDKPANVICEGDVCRMVTPEEAAAHAAKQEASSSSGSPLVSLLGETLLGKDGKTVPTASLCGPKKVIALYFSAHWCPPCRGFTPHLVEIYKKFKASHAEKDNFEIVFVSSDRSQEAFDEYYAEMPWLALDFAQREAKAKLGQAFKVRGIPSLIVLDGDSGDVITANGREAIGDDEECAQYPWRPKPLSEVILGPLVSKDGQETPSSEALAGKTTLVYFSAHWCPPCRNFTPQLVKAYNKLRADGKAVEVVFVSGDKSEAQFKEYLNEMPWLAVPFTDKERIGALNRVFEVEGIPTLIVLDEAFQVITRQGRGAVSSDPEGANFPWAPKPVDKLSTLTVSEINDMPVMLLALGGADEAAAAARAEQLMKAAATSPEGKGVRFLWGVHGDDILKSVLEFTRDEPHNPDQPEDLVTLVDVPSQVSYPTFLHGDKVTAEAIMSTLKAFKAGSMKARALGEDD